MAKYGPKPKPRGTLKPDDIPPWDCNTCGRSLPVSAYYESRTGAYGYWKMCKDCVLVKNRTYRESKGADHWRRQKILSNFGLTAEQFESLLERQGGCAICPAPEPGGKGSWHVDHDHACCPVSGKSCGRCVRGILCHNCNLMLGHAKDSIETLKMAIRYLGGGSGLESRATA